TEHLDRLGFQRALDDIGATARAGTDFSLRVMTANFDRGMELLADNELHPALPDAALQSLKPQIGRLIAARNLSPAYLTQHSLRTAIHQPNDPSLRDATTQSVSSLTSQDLRTYYTEAFRPDIATIVIVGNIAPERARQAVEKYFGAWKAEGPPPATDFPVEPS